MYPSPQEELILKEAENLMVETMARYDPSHDKYHVQRVRKTALSLANQLSSPDLLVVELAALLHDVLDKKYVSPEIATNASAFFRPYFALWAIASGIDLNADGRGLTIAQIIDSVSWSTEKRLRESGKWTDWHDRCIELHCVQDADRLDAIGAFGIMRCVAYSTATNRPLHTSSDDPNYSETAIQHFHDKLLHLCGRLKTDLGKQMGAQRHQFVRFLSNVLNAAAAEIQLLKLLDFLSAVDNEYNGN